MIFVQISQHARAAITTFSEMKIRGGHNRAVAALLQKLAYKDDLLQSRIA